jgi:hypothetical protein
VTTPRPTTDLAPGRLELPGSDAGPVANIQHARPRAGSDDPLHQRGGMAGAGPVVASGVGAERLRHLPVPMRLVH